LGLGDKLDNGKVRVRAVVLTEGNFRLATGAKAVVKLAMTSTGKSVLNKHLHSSAKFRMSFVTVTMGGHHIAQRVIWTTTN
jgi:hypothetical protein